MKFLITSFALLFFIIIGTGYSQNDAGDEEKFGITLSGFVKTDVMLDSRQTTTIREGHFLLYPAPEKKDPDGKDINARANFNILSIQTRLGGNITAPRSFGAKTSGYLEGEFFGHSEGDINGFRLRHAFVKLDWEKSSLLLGQFWHPMFITEVFPAVISFNTGAPFLPFSRNPQIRFVHRLSDFHITLTAASQRDFSNIGPLDAKTGSSSYLRNSAIPILDANFKYITKQMVIGTGINYKRIVPRLETRNGDKTSESVSGVSAMGFARYIYQDFTCKAEVTYGANPYDLTMLGGYAVKDTANGVDTYTTINTLAVWGELIYGKKIEFGLFGGYTQNLGSKDIIRGARYTRGDTISKVLRISPRVVFTMGKARLASEIEYTTAYYGASDPKAKAINTKAISNIRLLGAAILSF